jgi:para-nitrobenzyl esterase
MRAAGNDQVYAYRFDWDEEPSQLGFDLSTALGAAHGLEIAFVFNDFKGGFGIEYIYPGDEAQFDLADSISSYWTEFAANGPPEAKTVNRYHGYLGLPKACAALS